MRKFIVPFLAAGVLTIGCQSVYKNPEGKIINDPIPVDSDGDGVTDHHEDASGQKLTEERAIDPDVVGGAVGLVAPSLGPIGGPLALALLPLLTTILNRKN